MAINPKQILEILRDLLSPSGGIKSADEVGRVINLMQKFSRKMVSKCIYIKIIKSTSGSVVPVFLIGSGWELLTIWLSDAMTVDNQSLISELLTLFVHLPSPVFIKTEDVDRTRNLLYQLCRQPETRDDLKVLVLQLLMKWETDYINVEKIEAAPNALNKNKSNGKRNAKEKEKGQLNILGPTDNVNERKQVDNENNENRAAVDTVINDEPIDDFEPLMEIDLTVNVTNELRDVNEFEVNDELRVNDESIVTDELIEKNKLQRKVKTKPESKSNNAISMRKKMNISEKQELSKECFRKHININEENDGTQVFVCKNVECGVVTLYEAEALKHAILHSKGTRKRQRKRKPTVQCPKCEFSCIGKRELKKHWKTNHGQKEKLLCSQCLNSFSTKQSLQRHIATKHVIFTDEDAVPCAICNKQFRDKTAMKQHIQRVHTEKKFQCHSCPMTFARQCALKNHIKKIHEGNVVKFQCEECLKAFEDRSKLERHRIIHDKNVGPIVKAFKCDLCKQTFSSKGHLTRHHKTVHEKIKPFKCRFCDNSFRENYHKVRHELTNHFEEEEINIRGVEEEKNIIDWSFINKDLSDALESFSFSSPCAIDTGSGGSGVDSDEEGNMFNFSNPSILDYTSELSSIKELDNGKEKFVFTLPTVKGSKNDPIEDSIKTVHHNFSFTVPSNPKVSFSKQPIKEDSLFKCKECNKIFSKAYYLNGHMKSIHSPNFIHCDKCQKDFTSKYSFYQHRPCVIQCPHCDQVFSRTFFLKYHVKAVHKM